MPITWRPATWVDIEPALTIQEKSRGDALIGKQAAIAAWKHLFRDPFFASAILESKPAIQGHGLIGFGASVFISSAFANAEVANPRPDINTRIITGIHLGQSVLATRNEVARANAGVGVDVMILCGIWRDEIVNSEERYAVQSLLVSSFAEWHRGYRIRRIIHETADEAGRAFLRRSVEYKPIVAFADIGRVIHMMTLESVKAYPGSLGNIIFNHNEPVLRLRHSDQQLLLAAIGGATDPELAIELGISASAVKARWRSTFARIAEAMPKLVAGACDKQGRGTQKRHRVLAYTRGHPEELRPYDWKTKIGLGALHAYRTNYGP
ncbi:MAG: hypothetical protein ACR2I2_13600 [Bryobacteraceae bacterium]